MAKDSVKTEKIDFVFSRRAARERKIVPKEKQAHKGAPAPIRSSQIFAGNFASGNTFYECETLDIFSNESVAQQRRQRKRD